MKKQILKAVLIGLLGVSIQGMAQEHDHSNMNMDQKNDEIKSYNVDKTFQEQLNAVFSSNVKLNEAFMTEKSDQINKAAGSTLSKINEVDMTLLSGQAHMDWMQYQKVLKEELEAISNSLSIEDQRVNFATYNEALYKSIKAFGIGQESFYQFCPMANHNEGAFWLSAIKEIQNPYMGSRMPKCGTTKEVLN